MSFTEEKRREQIITQTIDVIAQYGLINASFSKIAERASITPGLITYHFQTKQKLITATLQYIQTKRLENIAQIQGADAQTWADRVMSLIETEIRYFRQRPNDWRAISEIVLGSRNASGQLLFAGIEDDPAKTMLRKLIRNKVPKTDKLEAVTFIIYSAYTNYLSLQHITQISAEQLASQLRQYVHIIDKESA